MTEPFDVEQADRLLTTTRAVRRKLDLERPVDDEVLLRMIDVAEQAPTGAGQSSRRWLVVRDPEQKRRVAAIYRDVAGPALAAMAGSVPAHGRAARTLASSQHLAEHLDRVPALVVVCIHGVHDGAGTPGLFDSVIQAAWQFCLAGRARGLGTAWTTLHLQRARDVAAVLGIPPGVTQIVLLPVAYTTTTDFSPAARTPAAEITYVDHWGFEPSARGVALEVDLDAPPADVWAVVTRITARVMGTAVVNEPERHLSYDSAAVGGLATRSRFVLQPLVGGGTRLAHGIRIVGDHATEPGDGRHDTLTRRLLAWRDDIAQVLADVRELVEDRDGA